MKKTRVFIVCTMVIVLLLTVVLAACNSQDIERKLQGVEIKFQQKLAKKDQYSFDVHLEINSSTLQSELDISCFKKGDEYAYSFYPPNSRVTEYRRLFADNKLYEFSSQPLLHTGSYSVKENVAYDDDSNLLYSLTQKIMLVSYATLFTTGTKETLGDVETYRYDFNLQGNQYSVWYDNENMVKVSATFNSTDESGNTTSDVYTAIFSDYVFDNVDADAFKRPADMGPLYVESPIPIEDWMNIITEFASRAGNWM